jgi:hypothetical protein
MRSPLSAIIWHERRPGRQGQTRPLAALPTVEMVDPEVDRLSDVLEAVEAAYRQARIEIYDQVPAGCPVDVHTLTESQRQVLDNLVSAEAELNEFRSSTRAQVTKSQALS